MTEIQKGQHAERKDIENVGDWEEAQILGRMAILRSELPVVNYSPRRQEEIRGQINRLEFELRYRAERGEA